MTEFEAEDFMTRAARRIAAIETSADYSRVYASLTGAPEWKSLPDLIIEPLLEALEEKRRKVLRASGALVG